MPLTDYIAPDVLREEGYIYKGDSHEMLENIDKDYLRSQGWVNLSALQNVPLSIHKAAQIIGIHPSTLASYVELGYIRSDESGRIAMIDALRFDYSKAKEMLLKSKTRIKIK